MVSPSRVPVAWAMSCSMIGDVGSGLLLGGGEPASGRDPVVEHRRLLHGPDPGVLAGELDVGGEHRLHGRHAGGGADQGRGACVEEAAAHRDDLEVLAVITPRAAAGVGDRGGHAEHREHGADGERDDQRGGQAAPPAPADVAQPDLRRAGQEADAAQQPVAGVLAADRGTGRFQRLPHRNPDGAPDRGQRGQRWPEQPHQRAGEDDGPVDAEADADREERRAEEAGQDVGEHGTEDDPGHCSQPAEQQRGLQVDRRDLPSAAADRLHDPDLRGLLGDQRRHRVRDQHERRQQGQQGDHVEELRGILESGLAGPVARGPRLRQVAETGEAGDGGERAGGSPRSSR